MSESGGSAKGTDKEGTSSHDATTDASHSIWTLNVKWTRTNVSVPVTTDTTMQISDFKSLAQARYREHQDCRFGGEVPVLVYRGTAISDNATIANCGAKNNDTLFAISVVPRTAAGATGANNFSTGTGATGNYTSGTNNVPGAFQYRPDTSGAFSAALRTAAQQHSNTTGNEQQPPPVQMNNTNTATGAHLAGPRSHISNTNNSTGTSTGTGRPNNTTNNTTVHTRNSANAHNTTVPPVRTAYPSQGFYPPTAATSSNSTDPLFNGMFDTGGMLGGMSQETVQQMMQNPYIQSLMERPEFVNMVLDSNPALRELRQRNPELNHILNDPQLLRESMEAVRNPNIFREAMRSNDRAMSNIEAMPGGFNALRRMYHTVQEPVWEAAVAGMSPQDATGEGTGMQEGVDTMGTGPPNCSALPNPWSPNRGRSANNGGTTAPQLPALSTAPPTAPPTAPAATPRTAPAATPTTQPAIVPIAEPTTAPATATTNAPTAESQVDVTSNIQTTNDTSMQSRTVEQDEDDDDDLYG